MSTSDRRHRRHPLVGGVPCERLAARETVVMTTVLTAAALVFAALAVTAVLLVIAHALLRRGVTRHEFRVFAVTLIACGALALAAILGVRLDTNLTVTLKTSSWVYIAGPTALAGIALALLWGKA